MAEETINLFEINIDTNKAVQDTIRLKAEIERLKVESENAKESQGSLSEEYINYQAQLKSTKTELRANEKLTQNIVSANKASEGSIAQLRSQLNVVSKQWAELSEEERTNTDEGKKLTAQKAQLTKALKAEEKATGDTRRNVGNYKDDIDDATSSTKTFGNTSNVVTDGMKSIEVATKSALGPIAVITGIFATLYKAIQRNSKASESLNKVIAVFKGVLDGVLNALSPVVEFLTDKLSAAFENPKQAIEDLGKSIKENLINRFKAFGVFGKAVSELLKGNFKESLKLAADASIQLTTGVTNATDKLQSAGKQVKKFVKSVAEESEKAIEINKLLANSERELLKIQKEFELQQLKFQDLAEKQRQIRDDEARSIEERISANKKLGEILDNQAKLELKLANDQLRFAKLKRKADGDTLETQEGIYDAQIKIAEIEERINGQRSEQLTNTNSLLKEQRDLEIENYRIKADAANKAFDDEVARLDEIFALEVKAIEDKQAAEQDNILAILDLEKIKLERQYEQEVYYAELIGADTTAIDDKYKDARIAIANAETDAKLSLAQGFAGNIAQIFGEQTALGKAAAVAETTINTYRSATAAYASLVGVGPAGPILAAAAAGAAVAAGLANVKKILAVKTPAGGSGGGSTPSSPATPSATTTSTPVTPEIGQGIVTRSANRNQTESLTMRPTLVIDSVTNAQNTQNDIGETGVL